MMNPFPSWSTTLVAISVIWCVASLRTVENEIQKGNEISMQFDGAFYKHDEGATMKISRQGEQIYEGKPTLYNFSLRDFHKEFVVTLNPPDGKDSCKETLFASGETMPGLCSTGLFSQSQLVCDESKGNFRPQWKKYESLEPHSNRGFGLEMEFVSREPLSDHLRLCKKLLKHEYDYDRDISEFLRSPRGKVYAVKQCAKNVTKYVPGDAECGDDNDCAIDDYCLDCSKCTGSLSYCARCNSDETRKVCSPRASCKPDLSGRSCPMALSHWNWMTDSSVVPLSANEAEALGADLNQTVGYSFEVTSPAPPNVLSGKQGFNSGVELLTLLKGMGIQAGPSQGMHVHINALNKDAPGELLQHEGIIAIWMAYAKYQLVIDEMLSPGRVGNPYANPLFLGNCEPNDGKTSCFRNPCGCNRRFFNQMHQWQELSDQREEPASNLEFCNFVLGLPGSPRSEQPCRSKYPHQRYSQLNLIPTYKFGTIEFRGHSATYSVTRVMRWTQFLVAFVEHFGHGKGALDILNSFSKKSAEEDYRNLQRQQEGATFEDLFNELTGLVDPETMNYYATRTWENGDRSCAYPDAPQVRVFKSCLPGGFSEDSTHVLARFQERIGSEMKMTIRIPRLRRGQVPSQANKITWYVSVLMPEGYTWKVFVMSVYNRRTDLYEPQDAEFYSESVKLNQGRGNLFWFMYNPDIIERDFVEETLQQHHRCCCVDETCLWYDEDLLHHNHCPSFEKTDNGGMCVSETPCNFFTKLSKTMVGCVKASHSRRRSGPTLCSVTRDANTFYNGTKCKK